MLDSDHVRNIRQTINASHDKTAVIDLDGDDKKLSRLAAFFILCSFMSTLDRA
jgi:hypothetical protein